MKNLTARMDRPIRSPRRSRGTTLAELLVACALLGTLVVTTSQMLVRNGRLHRQLAYEQLGLQELSNQLSELQWLEPHQVAGVVEQLAVSPEVAERLPEAVLTGRVHEAGDARQVTLELRWNATGRQTAPLRLTTWVYPKGAQP